MYYYLDLWAWNINTNPGKLSHSNLNYQQLKAKVSFIWADGFVYYILLI